MIQLCMIFRYYRLGWRSSPRLDEKSAIHLVIVLYFTGTLATYGVAFFVPNDAFYIQGVLLRCVIELLFTFAVTLLLNQRSAQLLRERQRLSG